MVQLNIIMWKRSTAKNCLGTLNSRLVTIILSGAPPELHPELFVNCENWETIILNIKLRTQRGDILPSFPDGVKRVGVFSQGVHQQLDMFWDLCHKVSYRYPSLPQNLDLMSVSSTSGTWRSKVGKIFFFKASMAKTQILTGDQILDFLADDSK